MGRKLSGTNGESMRLILGDIDATIREARATNEPQLVQIADRLRAGADALREATDWMLAAMKERDQDKALAGATAYLALAGDVISAETALAEAPGRVPGIVEGGQTFLEGSEALFGV